MTADVVDLATWRRSRNECWRSECPSGAAECPHPFTDACRWTSPLTTAEPDEAAPATARIAQPVTAPEQPVTAFSGDRNETIARIRAALRKRTGIAWSVTGGRGTAWGWITVTSPPARRIGDWRGYLSDQDRAILAGALGLETVHSQGVSIPAGNDYRTEYVDRAEGRDPSRIGEPYWD